MSRTAATAAITAAIALALVAAGCGGEEAGTPTPVTTSTPSTRIADTSSAPVLPPRTREVNLTGKDPCKALTTAQVRQLDYDIGYEYPPQRSNDEYDHGPTCDFSSAKRKVGARIIYSTTVGADIWLTDPHRRRTNPATITTIHGFPALQLTSVRLPDECYALVDNHDGQYVEVLASPDLAGSSTDTSFYCAEAKRVADMVMGTLSTG